MKIGIIGARLSGSYASLLLAGAGHEILLFDPSLSKEKPCGGGVTGKTLRSMAWLSDLRLPHTEIRTMRMFSREGGEATLPLRVPIRIFCRATLDSAIRDEACRAGARLISERAVAAARAPGGWTIQTPAQGYEVDFLVGADGVSGTVRAAVGVRFTSADLSLAIGFYLPGRHHPDTVLVEFQESGFQGYLWSFPRVDHASVGILRWLPATNAGELRKRVLNFIEAHYPRAAQEMRFYAARIPSLSSRRLAAQRVAGPDWALLGDAAGFVDAITAEGIYYALRSAELFSRALAAGRPITYESAWRSDFGADLFRAAAWRDRFFGGAFLFEAFNRRALQTIRHSGTVRLLTDELISGRTGYEQFRRRIIWNSPRILLEALAHKIMCA